MADIRKILQGAGEKVRQVANQVNNIADHFKTSDELAAIKKGVAEGIKKAAESDELATIKKGVAEGIKKAAESDELAAIKKGVAKGIEAIKEDAKEKTAEGFESVKKGTAKGIKKTAEGIEAIKEDAKEKAKGKTAEGFEAIKNTGKGFLQPSSFALGMWIGLWLPDIDLTMLPILHHRSILTHSVLIPWLLYIFARKRIPEYGIAGIYAGIAIHLSADCLSSLVGFGMIWTPWPFKVPLGPISPIWIVSNAILGVWLSLKLAPANRNWIIGGMLLVCVGYALFNEFAFLPFVVFGLIVSLVVWLCRNKVQKNPLKKNQYPKIKWTELRD